MTPHRAVGCACESFLERAREAMKRGEHASALPLLEEAIRACPTSHDAWDDQAICLERLGRRSEAQASFEEAVRCYSIAADAQPAELSLRVRAAYLLLGLGRPAESVAQADRVLAIDPKDLGALRTRAQALHMKGDRVAAFHAFAAAYDACPIDFRNVTDFGRFIEEMGDLELAAGLYALALRLNPIFMAARDNLDRVLAAIQASGGGHDRPVADTKAVIERLRRALERVER